MTSTPMSSSISAISIFSSNVMVAPGHCSPSRRVVSNTMTRSFSDFLAVVIGKFLLGRAPLSGAEGVSGDLAQPLSAQAQPPRRPSGADKKQKPAKKEGGQGRSRNRGVTHGLRRSTLNSKHFAANQHCQTLRTPESSAKTIDGSLPGPRPAVVLDEKYGRPQCQKMVRRGDLPLAPVCVFQGCLNGNIYGTICLWKFSNTSRLMVEAPIGTGSTTLMPRRPRR